MAGGVIPKRSQGPEHVAELPRLHAPQKQYAFRVHTRGQYAGAYAHSEQQKQLRSVGGSSWAGFAPNPMYTAGTELLRTCILRSSEGRAAMIWLARSMMDRADTAADELLPAGPLPPLPPPRTSASLATLVKTAATWISFSLGSCCITIRCRSARLLQEAMSTVSCLGCRAPIGREAA